ncbi:MAG: AbrB/MazE/SpoVT family DNA-binding domain-containing protein [bacterium]
MAQVRIGPKHQITIPKKVFDELHLAVGDVLEVATQNGKGVIIPTKTLVTKAPAVKLSAKEQKLLVSAKKKIAAINKDIRNSRGLTQAETLVAAKAGLIDPDQRYWWTEEWQKGERAAQRDIDEGRLSKEYDNVDEMLADLKKARA